MVGLQSFSGRSIHSAGFRVLSVSAHVFTWAQHGPAWGEPSAGIREVASGDRVWVCGHLQSVCYWWMCQITHFGSLGFLQHLLLDLVTACFLLKSSCYLVCGRHHWLSVSCILHFLLPNRPQHSHPPLCGFCLMREARPFLTLGEEICGSK